MLHAHSLQSCSTLWTIAYQAPLSLGFFRQQYWSGLPCPPPGNLPDPGIEPQSHVSFIGRLVLYHCHHLGSPKFLNLIQINKSILLNKSKGSIKCKIKQKRLTDKLFLSRCENLLLPIWKERAYQLVFSDFSYILMLPLLSKTVLLIRMRFYLWRSSLGHPVKSGSLI